MDRSVRWSEELSFRANHRFFCPLQDPQFGNLQMNERDRWILLFFAPFLVNNCWQSETNWQVPVKVSTCPTLMSTRNASIPVETNNPDHLAQIWRMEQAGEMVGQLNGEFYSFNDNTLSYGYISSVVDLFLGIDSFLCNLSWKLEERSNLKKWRVFPGKALS